MAPYNISPLSLSLSDNSPWAHDDHGASLPVWVGRHKGLACQRLRLNFTPGNVVRPVLKTPVVVEVCSVLVLFVREQRSKREGDVPVEQRV